MNAVEACQAADEDAPLLPVVSANQKGVALNPAPASVAVALTVNWVVESAVIEMMEGDGAVESTLKAIVSVAVVQLDVALLLSVLITLQ